MIFSETGLQDMLDCLQDAWLFTARYLDNTEIDIFRKSGRIIVGSMTMDWLIFLKFLITWGKTLNYSGKYCRSIRV